MEFILYSDVDERSISNSLGLPEYSYFFVLKAYRSVLEHHAGVHLAHSHAEIVQHHERLLKQGKTALALVFTPPNKAPVDLPCATLCVVAWEYDRIPDEAWDEDARNDWRYVFAQHGAAISLSQHTARAIKAAMGEDFPVLVLPTPLWQQFAQQRQHGQIRGVAKPCELEVRGFIIDTRLLGLSADGLIAPVHGEALPEGQQSSANTQVVEPLAIEPSPLAQHIAQAPRPLTLRNRLLATKYHALQWYREVLADLLPALLNSLIVRLRNARSRRALAVPSASDEHPQAVLPNTNDVVRTLVGGVVYVSVFNPQDGRKNWERLVTAFCWAFKEVEDATLILKITHRDLSTYYVHMLTLLSQLAPFKCRVLVMHGFLDDQQFSRLYSAASYYVNHSLCEGLCLPLMEFMACGKPALAPDHTAMADYIDDQVAFVTPYGSVHTIWGHDPRILYRSLRNRPDWGALVQAYKDSYQVAKEQPQRYAQMSDAALARMRSYAGEEQFWTQLDGFVQTLGAVAGSGCADALAGNAPC